MLFFHDTANEAFPNLAKIVVAVKEQGLPHKQFTVSSRPGEHCERGWLMVLNTKEGS
jgi:hypothetical protein